MFQSRRPGFGVCDGYVDAIMPASPARFSPVDRDLGFATA